MYWCEVMELCYFDPSFFFFLFFIKIKIKCIIIIITHIMPMLCVVYSFGNDDFQDSIRRVVPKGSQFKGYPACFGHTHQQEIWRHLTALPARNGNNQPTSIPLDLISTRGSSVHFGVRVRVFPFPEGISAVWVMLAVRAKPE
jgi:hypothetical protein